MAVKLDRTGWMQMFEQMRRPTGALSRMFTVKPGNIYNGNKVAIDIMRTCEDVAVTVTKIGDANMNDINTFTTKEFEPPKYGEAFPLTAGELLSRMAGQDPYSAAYQNYASQLVRKMALGFSMVDDKIMRGVELQAAQVLQTGKLSLTDTDGNVTYELDFKPKSSHFPTAGTTWGQAGDDKLGDILSVAKVVNTDGKVTPNELWMGEKAVTEFLKDDAVKAQLDNRRVTLGEINPVMQDSDVVFYGMVWVGNYQMAVYSTNSEYTDPQGNTKRYLNDGSVVVKSDRTRLDMASARVPLPVAPEPRVANLLPGRMASREQGYDVTPNVYASTNGMEIFGELHSRPLMIPVQIDGFGCLTTGL